MHVTPIGLATEDTGIVLENVISGAVDGFATDGPDGLPNINVDFDTSLRPPPRRYDPHERFQSPRVQHQRGNRSSSRTPSSYVPHRDSLHGESSSNVDERAIDREGTETHLSSIG